MGSVFDSASKKIHNLLEITAKGQATKTNSLPVTLASDEDDINIGDLLGITSLSGNTEIFNAGGTGGATDGAIRDTNNHDYNFAVDSQEALATHRAVFIYNGLNQNATVTFYAYQESYNARVAIWSETVNAGARAVLLPYAGGTGASAEIKTVAALASLIGNQARVRVTAASSPSSGAITISMQWRC